MIKNKIFILDAEKKRTEKEEKNLRNRKEKLFRKIEDTRKVQGVIQATIKDTQRNIEIGTSNIVSSLLHSISDNPYDFKVEFVERRNNVECDLYYVKDGRNHSIFGSSGHGCADLSSLGMKISYREMKENLRPILIIDEPFRQLEKKSHPLVAKALRELSEKAGMQFIIHTHETSLIKEAHRVFHVTMEKGVSHVEQQDQKDINIS